MKIRGLIFRSALYFVISLPAFAADTCEEFDLSEPGGSMEKVPALNQKQTAMCYTYSDAAAIDAWRFSNDPKSVQFLTSPHALAVDMQLDAPALKKQEKNRELFDNKITSPLDYSTGAASFKDSIVAAKKYGICSYEAFGESFENGKSLLTEKEFWDQITSVYKISRRGYAANISAIDQEALAKIEAYASAEVGAKLCAADLTSSNHADLKDVVSFVKAKYAQDALKVVSSEVCAGQTQKLPQDFPDPITFNLEQMPGPFRPSMARGIAYKKMLDAMLGFKNRQPIQISYCAKVLFDHSYLGVQTSNKDIGGDCIPHSSLIIGRKKMADGRCGYLIRNSWGIDQDSDNGIEASLDGKGNILVPEDALYNNLIEFAVLPPKGEKYIPPENLYDSAH